MRQVIVVAGVLIDLADSEETIARIEDFVSVGRSTGRAHQVATVNSQFVVNAWTDGSVRRILHSVDLATCDGAPLLWASRLLGGARGERVTGIDLVPKLAACSAENGFRIFLFGARPEVAQRAADVLRARYPGIEICGVLSPSDVRTDAVDPEIVSQIKEAKPDILLVALGNPKQEKWISLYAPVLGVPVSIGVGGTFDFLAGTTRRAPDWIQAAGLEWLYRLAQEPRRLWRRYLAAFVLFPAIFFYQLWLLICLRLSVIREREADPVGTQASVAGYLTRKNVGSFQRHVSQVLSLGSRVDLNVGNLMFVDSTALGALLVLCRDAARAGAVLSLQSVPPQLQRLIEALRLDPLLDALEHHSGKCGGGVGGEKVGY